MSDTTTDSLAVDYYTAAEMLSISKPTLERWVRDRKIPFVKAGKLVRFRRDSLNEWLREQETRCATSGDGSNQ